MGFQGFFERSDAPGLLSKMELTFAQGSETGAVVPSIFETA